MADQRTVAAADENELHRAIFALSGILDALNWLDDGFLADKLEAGEIKTAQTHLLAAGRLICEQAAERF